MRNLYLHAATVTTELVTHPSVGEQGENPASAVGASFSGVECDWNRQGLRPQPRWRTLSSSGSQLSVQLVHDSL